MNRTLIARFRMYVLWLTEYIDNVPTRLYGGQGVRGEV